MSDDSDMSGMSTEQDLTVVVREIEQHASEAGWDRPAELFALVPTADLIAREPALAAQLGNATGLTPVQQDDVAGEELEDLLQRIVWPEAVAGCAAVVERLVLPQGADDSLPDDPAEAAAYVADHPDRQEMRIVAAATRDGATQCALRLRSHDEDDKVLVGPDLVPALLELLHATLEAPADGSDSADGADGQEQE